MERNGHYDSVADLLDSVLAKSGYVRHAARWHRRGRGSLRQPAGVAQRRRAVHAGHARPAARPEPARPLPGGSEPGQRQRPVGRHSRRGHAADAAHRQGAGVSRRLHRRPGRGHPAAQPQPGERRPGGHGRGAATVLCGHYARQEAALSHPLLPAQPVGRQQHAGAQPLPRARSPPNCSRAWSTAAGGARQATSA